MIFMLILRSRAHPSTPKPGPKARTNQNPNPIEEQRKLPKTKRERVGQGRRSWEYPSNPGGKKEIKMVIIFTLASPLNDFPFVLLKQIENYTQCFERMGILHNCSCCCNLTTILQARKKVPYIRIRTRTRRGHGPKGEHKFPNQ